VNQAFERLSGLFQVNFDLPMSFGTAQISPANLDPQLLPIGHVFEFGGGGFVSDIIGNHRGACASKLERDGPADSPGPACNQESP
jgi:hypothetical protein